MTASPTDNLASAERRIQELTKELSLARGELAEAREQQASTVNVLKVISRSTFDLQPVLEALIKDATKLCAAEQGFIFRSDGELYHLAADCNAPAGFREWRRHRGIRPGDASVVGRVARSEERRVGKGWRSRWSQCH